MSINRASFTLWLAIVSLASLVGCNTIGLPSQKELTRAQAGQASVVLIRVTGKDYKGQALTPFWSALVDDNVSFALGTPESGGVPDRRVEPMRFLSSESRAQGWTYLVLEPGTHFLAIQPPRWNNIFSYMDFFKYAPRWIIEVPPNVPVLYAGTVELQGIAVEGLFGIETQVAFDALSSEVVDEEPTAANLASQHLSEQGAITTLLMEPSHP